MRMAIVFLLFHMFTEVQLIEKDKHVGNIFSIFYKKIFTEFC